MSTYLYSDGSGVPATADLTTAITGDLDVRAKIRATDWTPAGRWPSIAAQFEGANQNWAFHLDGSGALALYYSLDGTALLYAASTAVLQTAASLTDNVTDIWVRLVHDVDNGAAGNDIKFYYGTDGATWTQLGTTVTAAGTVARYNSTAVHYAGAAAGLTYWTGRIYSAEIRSGIGGTAVAAPDFTTWAVTDTVKDDAQGNTWTLTSAVIQDDPLLDPVAIPLYAPMRRRRRRR